MYQPRFIAYLIHTGQEPEEVDNLHFTQWIMQRWKEFEELFGVKRPYTEEQHERFTAWLFDTAPEGQLMF